MPRGRVVGSSLTARGCRRRLQADPARAASCAAPSWARPCCPSASRCRCSPATRCPRWPTPRTRSSSCCRSPARRRTSGPWKIGIAVAARDAHGGGVLPAERARLPERRRRLRGRDRQPRPQRRASPSPARCWSTTCSPWRCRSRRAPQYAAVRDPVRSAATRRRSPPALVVLLTALNLRGVRESGTFFAVPTYVFMVAILGHVRATGMIQCFAGDAPAGRERRPAGSSRRRATRPS